MGWLLVAVVLVVVVVLFARSSASTTTAQPPTKPRLAASPRPRPSADMARIYREAQAETEKLYAETLREVEREAAVQQEGVEREWEREKALEADEPDPLPTVTRREYVPKEDEGRYLTRDADGLPELRLVDAGERLSIWSPLDGGALINPRGVGLRQMGLYSTPARGSNFHRQAYRAADLRKGRWLTLKREPDNAHDNNAVAMYAPAAGELFAYVMKGKARAVARRMDAGEDMAALSLRGPRPGDDEETMLALVGSRADLTAMLDG